MREWKSNIDDGVRCGRGMWLLSCLTWCQAAKNSRCWICKCPGVALTSVQGLDQQCPGAGSTSVCCCVCRWQGCISGWAVPGPAAGRQWCHGAVWPHLPGPCWCTHNKWQQCGGHHHSGTADWGGRETPDRCRRLPEDRGARGTAQGQRGTTAVWAAIWQDDADRSWGQRISWKVSIRSGQQSDRMTQTALEARKLAETSVTGPVK